MFKRHLIKSACATAFLLASIVFPSFGQAAEPLSLPRHPDAVDSTGDGYFTLRADGMDCPETDVCGPDGADCSESYMCHVEGGVKISFPPFVKEKDESVLKKNGSDMSAPVEIKTAAIDINSRERTVSAEGPFQMSIGKYVFEGKSFQYFYEDERGSLDKVSSSIDGANFAAGSVEFSSSTGIIMKDVVATTCCMDNMQYHVEAGTVELTDGDRAKFRDISIYFRNRKIFKWSSYTMRMGQFGGDEIAATAAPATGGWSYSSPSLGYSSYGGLELKTDIKHVNMKRKLTSGLFLDYFAMDGLFTEGRVERKTGSDYSYALRYGKQYKANTGYFRYFAPVIVWNEPVLEIIKAENRFPGTKIYFTGRLEAGRMREKRTGKAIDRAFMNAQGRYPLNAESRRMRFSLLTDGRFAMYRKYQDFKLWGSGFEMEAGAPGSRMMRLQYMRFRNSGKTPFRSDLVNTNSKLFGFGSVKINNRNSVMVDAQYDLERSKFDEVEYTLIRNYDCLKFYFSWKSELKSIGMNMQILSPSRKKK